MLDRLGKLIGWAGDAVAGFFALLAFVVLIVRGEWGEVASCSFSVAAII